MKALVRDRYGTPDVLRFEEQPKPEPSEHEVLVRIRAASVNTADLDYLLGRPAATRFATGMRTPKSRRLGLDVAGEVEAVGAAVTRFRPGDEVIGDLTQFGYGAFAEYVAAPQAAFAPKPKNLTFEQAATVPQSGILAVQTSLGKGPIHADDKVLVNGASGGVGPFVVQIAKSFGAEVTGVASTGKLDLVRAVGADHVIDYGTTDFTLGTERYDLIVDIAAHRSILDIRRVMAPRGRYVWAGGSLGRMAQAMIVGGALALVGRKRMGIVMWKPFAPDDVATITRLIESGKVTPVMDRTYPLDDVIEALRDQESGKARGKLVISM